MNKFIKERTEILRNPFSFQKPELLGQSLKIHR